MESTEDLDYYRAYVLPHGPRAIVATPVIQLNNTNLENNEDLDYYRSYLAKV